MILEVTEALVDVIHDATPDLAPWVQINSLVEGDTAPEDNKAAIALIAVAPHPHMINRPLVEGNAGLVRAPLSLKLTYLITYFGVHDEAQTRLGRIVQAFHTTPVLTGADLVPPLKGTVDAIAIRLLSPTHDERNQVWGVLGRPGKVALFYEVDVAPVPILEREGAGRILTHRVDYVGAP
ncbi:Pvc16 family protein [Demequina sp.]|uniref:Pvc16 family protein n=1 Tax=Demequina sp. TaxID=2050685 RepID=UPI003D0AE428